MTRSDQFELHYLTPIIFYRAVEQDLGSPDNAFIGLDYKINFFETAQVYGQFLLDEFNLRKSVHVTAGGRTSLPFRQA